MIDTLEILQLALRLLGVKFLHILRMCLICPKPFQNFILQLIFPKMHENLSANLIYVTDCKFLNRYVTLLR